MLLFAAFLIYTVGIWIVTQAENPALRSGLASLLKRLYFLFFSLKNAKELVDERFYANLAKAS